MHDADGQPASLYGHATGAVIEVILEDGALRFSINGDTPVKAVGGFPAGQPLRPWAVLPRGGDRVTFTCRYL